MQILRATSIRHPFKNERTSATRPLKLIHTDLCGPIKPQTWDGNHYFITFMDDLTHFTMVKLLTGKFEVFDTIKEFVNEAENKWNLKVSKIRCDNGREYKNYNIINWAKQKGIVIDFTIPYTPQFNGKVERLNQTLLEEVQVLLTDSKLEKAMWGEALFRATYLVNRSPTTQLEVTPAHQHK